MPRRTQLNSKQKKGLDKLSEELIKSLAEDLVEEFEKILPTNDTSLSNEVTITATSDSFTIKLNDSFNPILLPSKYAGESVFSPKGISPNSMLPYGYSADTKQHFRRTQKGITQVSAHTKYYSLGYKPVQNKTGDWYTASSKNNFGIRMTELRIGRSFVNDAWDRVYRKIPKEFRNQLPKAIQIIE